MKQARSWGTTILLISLGSGFLLVDRTHFFFGGRPKSFRSGEHYDGAWLARTDVYVLQKCVIVCPVFTPCEVFKSFAFSIGQLKTILFNGGERLLKQLFQKEGVCNRVPDDG